MDIVQLSEIGLSDMLYDIFSNPMLQAIAIGGSIAYVAFMYGKNTRERTIKNFKLSYKRRLSTYR